jgi:PEP-CTERM motif
LEFLHPPVEFPYKSAPRAWLLAAVTILKSSSYEIGMGFAHIWAKGVNLLNIIWKTAFLILAVVGLISAPALATTISFSGSGTGPSGADLSAQAIFDITGDTLTVTLINTATSDNTSSNQDVPGSTLTGVFFDLTGDPSLATLSALIAAGSVVQADQCDVGPCDGTTTNVGGEFFYGTGAFAGGATQGIASAGYVGGNGNFNGPNLDDPAAVDGINFGIISNDSSFLPNGGLASEPLIRNQVVFQLTGVDGLTIDDISNVSFQYGTALTETNIPGRTTHQLVPEPGTLVLLACGLAALGLYRRRDGNG